MGSLHYYRNPLNIPPLPHEVILAEFLGILAGEIQYQEKAQGISLEGIAKEISGGIFQEIPGRILEGIPETILERIPGEIFKTNLGEIPGRCPEEIPKGTQQESPVEEHPERVTKNFANNPGKNLKRLSI